MAPRLHSTVPNRMHLGEGHQRDVESALIEHGWTVQEWGLGLIDDPFHSLLRDQPNVVLWRWIPDMIAGRGNKVVLIDAKASWRQDTAYHTLELNAYQAHMAMAALGLVIVYVWGDFTCNKPQTLKIVDITTPSFGKQRVHTAGGSGTSYLRVRKDEQVPFDRWFA